MPEVPVKRKGIETRAGSFLTDDKARKTTRASSRQVLFVSDIVEAGN